jgi:hypothetical protein
VRVLAHSEFKRYEGDFEGNKMHGKGTFTGTDGSIYVGPFEEGEKSGRGIQKMEDGSKYTGEFMVCDIRFKFCNRLHFARFSGYEFYVVLSKLAPVCAVASTLIHPCSCHAFLSSHSARSNVLMHLKSIRDQGQGSWGI